MEIQKIVIPKRKDEETYELYFHGGKLCEEGFIAITKDEILETNTYFNSFSIMKWKKYTKIKNLKLHLEIEGKCEISIAYAWIDDKNVIRLKGDNIVAYKKKTEEREKIDLEYLPCEQGVIAYYIIKGMSDVKLYKAVYLSDVEETGLNDVYMALGICTYRREEYIQRNLLAIKNELIDNNNSVLKDNLEIYVSDNGQTLDTCESERIHVFPNKNLGGSGGFTRCMIEAKKAKKHTHIILMDDDIQVDTSILEKNYVLLQLIKDEYKDAMIGGSMLVLNRPYMQFENGALYRKGELAFFNKNIDLRTFRHTIKNEFLHDRNYNAWCYCCMPLDRITDDNLPLPLFIHMDDVEYGTRNQFPVITMNGIGVWHPFYENQRNASIVYYDMRNKLIVMAELGGMLINEYAKRWLDIFHRSIFNYDYNRTLAACDAIEDFLKGIDTFKNIDAIKLNADLSKYNYAWEDINVELEKEILTELPSPVISKKHLIKDYLLPSKKQRIVVDGNIASVFPYRVKEVVLINRVTGKQTTFKKSIVKMLYCKWRCRKAKKLINQQIYDVSIEWKDRIGEVTNMEFWQKYLEINEV